MGRPEMGQERRCADAQFGDDTERVLQRWSSAMGRFPKLPLPSKHQFRTQEVPSVINRVLCRCRELVQSDRLVSVFRT
jgi:hypothetical protein